MSTNEGLNGTNQHRRRTNEGHWFWIEFWYGWCWRHGPTNTIINWDISQISFRNPFNLSLLKTLQSQIKWMQMIQSTRKQSTCFDWKHRMQCSYIKTDNLLYRYYINRIIYKCYVCFFFINPLIHSSQMYVHLR